jgi:hypothetical protein
MASPRDPATKEELEHLEDRINYAETAMGFILASLSKQVDMRAVFADALQEAERLNTRRAVVRSISKIRDSVQEAEKRKALIERRSREANSNDDDAFLL